GWGPAAVKGVLNPPAGAQSPEGEPRGWGPAAVKDARPRALRPRLAAVCSILVAVAGAFWLWERTLG
ncbi:MAG: hypothetical protein ACRD1X_11085, partial [Vicinamibacteria bacterium]